MKTRKTSVYGLIAVMLAFAFALTACDNNPDPTPAHTHSYSAAWSKDATQHWRECTANDGAKIDTANHTAGDWIIDQAATATTAGSKHKECTVCGYETATEAIPATGEGHIHDWQWVITAPATTEAEGLETETCTTCGETRATRPIPQLPDPCECNGKAEDCECADCDCDTCEPETTPPAAHAGEDQTATLAHDLTITLDGSKSADPDGSIVSYAWTCTDKPNGAAMPTFNGALQNPEVSGFNKAGTYTFQLVVTDNKGKTDTDTVTVNVEPMTKSITVPAITTVANPLNFGAVSALSGWDNDFPSTDVTYTLALTQGGTTKATGTTSISASGQAGGVYTVTQTFYYKGTPISGGSRSVGIEIFFSAFGDMCISETDYSEGSLTPLTLLLSKDTLEPETTPPAAHAGEDFEHDINEGTSITLDGSGTSKGTIKAYAWSCTKYPTDAAEPTFSDTAVAKPTVNGFTKLGEYEFTLKVTDDNGTESVGAAVTVLLVRTASANITIPAITFIRNVAELDFSVGYGNIDSVFDGRITYKISDGINTIADTSANPTFNGKITASSEYDALGEITFTQTFYYDGNEIAEKNRSVIVGVSGYTFIYFIDEDDNPVTSITIPSLNTFLSEKVSEGNWRSRNGA